MPTADTSMQRTTESKWIKKRMNKCWNLLCCMKIILYTIHRHSTHCSYLTFHDKGFDFQTNNFHIQIEWTTWPLTKSKQSTKATHVFYSRLTGVRWFTYNHISMLNGQKSENAECLTSFTGYPMDPCIKFSITHSFSFMCYVCYMSSSTHW